MKEALQIIGKTILGIFGSVLGIAVLCCVILLSWSAVQISRGEVTDTLPVTPDDFTPAVRIIAFTDTHNENENVAAAIQKAYELFDTDPTYGGVDAFFGLGDFTSIGTEPDYEAYANTLKENVREETPCINVLGNHEMKTAEYESLFTKYFGHDINTVTEINGFTCIAFSGDRFLTEWTVTPSSISWLSEQIETANNKNDGKPIFVFQHPHPFGTVYGSTLWCNPQLNPVFAGNNRLINFSGHSHFPMNDPRSINQNTYTSVGVGAMARFELDKDYIIGQHPAGYEDATQFCVIEADNDGSVRIRGFDVLSGTFFCDYYIENVNDSSTFAYTYKNMKAHDRAPVFPADSIASAQQNENGDYTVSFTQAIPADGYIVHEYKIAVTDANGKTVFEDNLISDYFIIDDIDMFSFTAGNGVLQANSIYTLTVTAESAYRLYSEPVALTFTT